MESDVGRQVGDVSGVEHLKTCRGGRKEGAAVQVIKGESGRKTRATGGKNGEVTEKQTGPITRPEAGI